MCLIYEANLQTIYAELAFHVIKIFERLVGSEKHIP